MQAIAARILLARQRVTIEFRIVVDDADLDCLVAQFLAANVIKRSGEELALDGWRHLRHEITERF